MQMHFRVRSVLLSHGQAAVTMEPVEWTRPDPEGGVDPEGFALSWLDADPDHPDAEPFEPGGKMTELRIAVDEDVAPFAPREFVTVTVESTESAWRPGSNGHNPETCLHTSLVKAPGQPATCSLCGIDPHG